MFLKKGFSRGSRKINIIHSNNSRICTFSTAISRKNSQSIPIKEKYDKSEVTKIPENVNPFGIPLLHRSIEKRLFGVSGKNIKNIDLKSAQDHLSAFNINVKDVENGKDIIDR